MSVQTHPRGRRARRARRRQRRMPLISVDLASGPSWCVDWSPDYLTALVGIPATILLSASPARLNYTSSRLSQEQFEREYLNKPVPAIEPLDAIREMIANRKIRKHQSDALPPSPNPR